MRCQTCGEVYPSRYYFRTDTLCLECYRKEHPEETDVAYTEVGTREVADLPLKCPHCGHDQFRHRQTLLNTRGLTILGMEWANKEADNYICERCGYVSWFVRGEKE